MRSGPKLALGERFADRYRILELLGVGGMGAVYEAEDEQVGERVALKLLAPTDEVDELARSRFRREVMAVQAELGRAREESAGKEG